MGSMEQASTPHDDEGDIHGHKGNCEGSVVVDYAAHQNLAEVQEGDSNVEPGTEPALLLGDNSSDEHLPVNNDTQLAVSSDPNAFVSECEFAIENANGHDPVNQLLYLREDKTNDINPTGRKYGPNEEYTKGEQLVESEPRGEDKSSEVFVIRDRKSMMQFAMKSMLYKNFKMSELLNVVDDPGIVPIYGAVLTTEDGKLMIQLILEYFEGQTLAHVVMNEVLLTLTDVIKIFDCLLRVLCRLHAVRITHGDIHALNVLYGDELKQTKLIDFGQSMKHPIQEGTSEQSKKAWENKDVSNVCTCIADLLDEELGVVIDEEDLSAETSDLKSLLDRGKDATSPPSAVELRDNLKWIINDVDKKLKARGMV